ncbi:hypothetical protein AQ490_20105 [Wenjunlia vitaminophila]|uniref:Thioesterase TesA-like domain-containing protein n=1 Tax=Wenjunlia vitaminophila TaxID=76728 RepID=A0A0T6LUC7_WENVI|nr:alpha/beta fold hydrolase [Wenjunlia vitaminophila]KRV49622.1 hypothetical protein AQ490_20105 [Wenjunlia vitaminophila]
MDESPRTAHPHWFPRLRPDGPDATVRVYCLPFAGGAADAYQPWADHLPDWVRLRAVQLPGRGGRAGEPAAASVAEVVSGVADAIAGEDDGLPFGLFGHSMGALLAFELTRELHRRGGAQPVLLGVSGWPAPDTGLPHVPFTGRLAPLTQEQFVQVMGGMGAISPQVLADPALLDQVIPPMQADFAVIEAYEYRAGDRVTVPVSVFSGTGDPLTPMEKLHGWAAQTTGAVRVRRYEGDHFFLFDHTAAMVKTFTDDLERLAHGGTGH